MNSRESAAAQGQSLKAASQRAINEKSDAQLGRYLGLARFRVLAGVGDKRESAPKGSDGH